MRELDRKTETLLLDCAGLRQWFTPELLDASDADTAEESGSLEGSGAVLCAGTVARGWYLLSDPGVAGSGSGSGSSEVLEFARVAMMAGCLRGSGADSKGAFTLVGTYAGSGSAEFEQIYSDARLPRVSFRGKFQRGRGLTVAGTRAVAGNPSHSFSITLGVSEDLQSAQHDHQLRWLDPAASIAEAAGATRAPCGVCGRRARASDRTWRCAQCSFEVCPLCAVCPRGELGAAPKATHLHKHPLFLGTPYSGMSWSCDVCGKVPTPD